MNHNHIDLNQLEALANGDGRPLNVSAGDWRALIIVAYFTGLRGCDLQRLWSAHIDFAAGTLSMVLLKTGKPVCLPLHPIAAMHLPQLRSVNGITFSFVTKARGIITGLRRLAYESIESVAPETAPALLGHGGADVNFERLRAAVAAMPFPLAWKGGVE